MPHWAKIKVWVGLLSNWRSRGEFMPCFSQLLEASLAHRPLVAIISQTSAVVTLLSLILSKVVLC